MKQEMLCQPVLFSLYVVWALVCCNELLSL